MIGEFVPDALAEDLPTPVFIFGSTDLDIRWLNQMAEEWLGQSARAVLGRSFCDFLRACEDIENAAKRCGETETAVSLRGFIVMRKDAADERCHITLFPTQGRIGMIISLLATQPNDTKSNELAVSAMGRMLAHEIKNPLAGIHGAAQLLSDDVTSDEGQALIKLIASETDRIRRLTDRMETLGDRNPENVSLVNIHEVLRDARKLVQSSSEHDIVFTETYDPSLPETLGDRDTLMQAILNVIKNASEAISTTNNSGEISLETAFRAGVSRKTPSGEKGHSLPIEIRIIDNGPGISPAIRDQIFQPFVTNKPSGQGLGLALVSKVAAAHGGLVEVRSRPGKTVFSILLPMLTEEDQS
jgi:two-component system nitrogen regulation sensor histidine kinase GlnL